MKKLLFFFLTAIIMLLTACRSQKKNEFVLVKGGVFVNANSNYYEKNITIPDFYIGKYEVTQKEWKEVMGSNPSEFKGDNLPVEMVSWYDCIEYCNKRSEKEGLEPYYKIDKDQKDEHNRNDVDTIKWTVTVNGGANGYRLPTDHEWEYAAGGGRDSKSYLYSGSNNVDEVAWYWRNVGDKYISGDWNWPAIENNNSKPKSVGANKPNELGLYDMSGNVREWCWEWYGDLEDYEDSLRVWRGGGWIGDVHACQVSYRGKYEPNGKGPDQGFRLCRSD